MKKNTIESGFTIIEVVITLAMLALFLTFFFQTYLAMESQRVTVAREALASDIADSNLRKFVTRPAGLTCTVGGDMDLTAANPETKVGTLVGSHTDTTPNSYGFQAEPTSVTQKLGDTVTQSVRAFAPKGCTEPTYTNTPIKIEATVTFGATGKVVHASYVN
jgi:prepilin-type N-terminal cleavage/methylation domain-containing protein